MNPTKADFCGSWKGQTLLSQYLFFSTTLFWEELFWAILAQKFLQINAVRYSLTFFIKINPQRTMMATPCTYGSLVTYIPLLLFHTYRHCVKPLAANCFHITEQPGDLGGFPRPPTLGHGVCTFSNAYHQSHSGCTAVQVRGEGRHLPLQAAQHYGLGPSWWHLCYCQATKATLKKRRLHIWVM